MRSSQPDRETQRVTDRTTERQTERGREKEKEAEEENKITMKIVSSQPQRLPSPSYFFPLSASSPLFFSPFILVVFFLPLFFSLPSILLSIFFYVLLSSSLSTLLSIFSVISLLILLIASLTLSLPPDSSLIFYHNPLPLSTFSLSLNLLSVLIFSFSLLS